MKCKKLNPRVEQVKYFSPKATPPRFVVDAEWASHEITELQNKLEVEMSRETCKDCGESMSPSLIESGSCFACIKSEKTIQELDSNRRRRIKAETALANKNELVCELKKRLAAVSNS